MPLNFVKFQRGSQAQYDRVKAAGRLESDALYFIYDSTEPNAGGLLYLGNILIGGTGIQGATKLEDLSDINLSSASSLVDGMILQYNITSKKWEPKRIKQAIENSGANIGSSTGGNSIKILNITVENTDNIIQQLETIDDEPAVGDIVFVNNNPYIYNGTTWQELNGNSIEERLGQIENNLQAINTKILQIDTQNNPLFYEIVQELPIITTQNVEALKKKMYLVPNGETIGNNRYDKFIIVNNKYERINEPQPVLANYVTANTFEETVGNLQNAIDGLTSVQSGYMKVNDFNDIIGDIEDLRLVTGNDNANIIEELLDLHDRLTWRDILDT